MSYILDALKKADEQRQRAEPPTLRSAPAVVTATKKPSTWRYALIAVVLIGVALMAGWLQSRSSSKPSSSEPTAASHKPLAANPSPPAFTAPPFPIPSMPAPPLPLPQTTVAAPHMSTNPPAANITHGVPAAAEAPSGRLLTMDELPIPVRQALPAMTVSMHAWSATPKARLVSINNQVLHEGDSVAPGLTLEEITTDGMIMSFRGYRFRRDVR